MNFLPGWHGAAFNSRSMAPAIKAAPTLVGIGNPVVSFAGENIDVSRPAGTAVGDLLGCLVTHVGSASFTTIVAGGYSSIGIYCSGVTHFFELLGRNSATLTAADNITIQFPGGTTCGIACIVAYRGAYGIMNNSTGSGSAYDPITLTYVPAARIIQMFGSRGTTTTIAGSPAGAYTEDMDVNGTNGTSYLNLAIDAVNVSTAGGSAPSGSRTFTGSPTGTLRLTVELSPA